NSTQLGVQIRFTTGTTPSAPSAHPLISPMTPTITSQRIFANGARELRRTFPAIRPRIIVPSVGMKLSVEYPPRLKRKGFSRGRRFMNHVSNDHAALLFFCQWAAKPESPCVSSHVFVTPTCAVSNVAPGSG